MAGFLIAISNPLNLVFWFGIYGSTLSSLLTKVTKQEAFLYSLCIIAGIILWNLNIAFFCTFWKNFIKTKSAWLHNSRSRYYFSRIFYTFCIQSFTVVHIRLKGRFLCIEPLLTEKKLSLR